MGADENGAVFVVGRVRIDPPLNRAEVDYLTAFAESRRWQRAGGPYAVPDHPLAEGAGRDVDYSAYGTAAIGQPGLTCCWCPDPDGVSLVPSTPAAPGPQCGGGESADEVVDWLVYLRDHFLTPGARVAGRAEFTEFSFDHVLCGAVAVYGVETGRLGLVRVVRSVISLSWPADSDLVA